MQTLTGPVRAEPMTSEATGLPKWWPELVTRLSSPVADAVAVALFAFAGLAAFFYVHTYSVNMIYDDQWTDIDLLKRAHDGTLTWSYLWAQHNEHRMLFPKLVVLALGATTHFNLQAEDYLCVVALCGATALVILTHRRRTPGLPMIVYVPVAFVLLSPVVIAEALLGFNIAWFMALLGFGVVLYLFDAEVVSRVAFVAAVVVAVVASYSCLQGLLIWPSLLVLLWLRRRSLAALGIWLGAGVVTTVVYFIGFDFALARAGSGAAPQTLEATLRFFVVETGNVFGSEAGYGVEKFFGGVVLGLAVVTLAVGLRRGVADGAPVGVALITFGLAFLLSATVGRSQLGLGDAIRYAPFVLLILIGTYLILLSWCERVLDPPEQGAVVDLAWVSPSTRLWTPLVLFACALALSAGQAVESNRVGPADSGGWHSEQVTIANVTVNIAKLPDYVVQDNLGGYAPSYMRAMTAYARQAKLSLFATSLATQQERAGLQPQLEATVIFPHNEAHLKGTFYMRAGVVARDVTDVEFVLYGQGLDDASVASGKWTPTGWIARWNTHNVGDGPYYLAVEASTASGLTYTSAYISVDVGNH